MSKNEKDAEMILSAKACKITCKILSIFAKIGEVLLTVAAVCAVVAGVFICVKQSEININEMVNSAKNELNTEAFVSISGSGVEYFLNKSHNEQIAIVLVVLVVGAVALYFTAMMLRNIHRIFKNLDCGKTPFMVENVVIIQNIAKWLFASLILLDVASMVLSLVLSGQTISVNISLGHYALGFVLLVLAVVFRHGCELEKEK